MYVILNKNIRGRQKAKRTRQSKAKLMTVDHKTIDGIIYQSIQMKCIPKQNKQ